MLGQEVTVNQVMSSGSSENSLGFGSHDVSLHVSGQQATYLGLARIEYANPSADQLLDMETSPDSRDYVRYIRSLSKTQAAYVRDLVIAHLNNTLNGRIPSDEEINNMRAERSGIYKVS